MQHHAITIVPAHDVWLLVQTGVGGLQTAHLSFGPCGDTSKLVLHILRFSSSSACALLALWLYILIAWCCRLLQLTWLTPKVYSYHVDDFDDVRELRTPLRDGWGATSDGRSVIVSDGSSRLTWLDPQDLSLRRSVEVRDGIFPVKYLNEVMRWAAQAAAEARGFACARSHCPGGCMRARAHYKILDYFCTRFAGTLVVLPNL